MTHAQTDHIRVCRKSWICHHERCVQCTAWIDAVPHFHPCEQGRILYEEYYQAIEANRNCERVTGTEATCEPQKQT